MDLLPPTMEVGQVKLKPQLKNCEIFNRILNAKLLIWRMAQYPEWRELIKFWIQYFLWIVVLIDGVISKYKNVHNIIIKVWSERVWQLVICWSLHTAPWLSAPPALLTLFHYQVHNGGTVRFIILINMFLLHISLIIWYLSQTTQ